MTIEADAALGVIDDRKAIRNTLILAIAGALGGAVPSIIFITAPLAAAYELLGDDKSFATLPITAFVVGTACGAVPAALMMRRIGRRPGFLIGAAIAAAGVAFCALAMAVGSFWLLCIGSCLAGFSAAFVQQYRFAAADAASPEFRPRAISWVLVGGVAAAVIGPQTVILFAHSVPSVPYAGAYLGALLLCVAAAGILLFLDIPKPPQQRSADTGRPLGAIARRPEFLVAVGCATSAYALMNFVMTAAPLAMTMHGHHEHDAALGIQWHVLAMFGPSFVTGSLIGRFGAEKIVATGLALLIGCALVGLSGTSVAHFWLALILLGLGWNFGFIGGTALVTQTYRPEEKEKVQALNDFVIFGSVAVASFSSGETLLLGGWDVVNWIVLPVAIACLMTLFWQIRRQGRVSAAA